MGLIVLIIIIVVVILLLRRGKNSNQESSSNLTRENGEQTSYDVSYPAPKTVEGKLALMARIANLMMNTIKMSCVSMLCVQKIGEEVTWCRLNVYDGLGVLDLTQFTQMLRSNGYKENEIQWIKSITKTNEKGKLEVDYQETVFQVFDPNQIKKIIWDVNPSTRIDVNKPDAYSFAVLGIMKQNWDEKLI